MKKSILIVGQSNMAGRGFINQVPEITDERIYMWRNTRWQMMNEPINFDRHVAGIGPSASFAAAWLLDHPEDEIAIIPCAEGGSTISEWQSDQPLFTNAITQAKVALENTELVAILWHQGESDSHSDLYINYEKKLIDVLESFRSQLNLPNVPIVIGTLSDELGKAGFGMSCTQFGKINDIIEKVGNSIPYVGLASAEGLSLNPDGIHLDSMSQRVFGIRYYQAYTKLMNNPKSLLNETEILEDIYSKKPTQAEKMNKLNTQFALGKISIDTYMESYQSINQGE